MVAKDNHIIFVLALELGKLKCAFKLSAIALKISSIYII